MTRTMIETMPRGRKKLVIEETVTDSLDFVHLDSHLSATIMGQPAHVVFIPDKSLVASVDLLRPPMLSVSINVYNGEGFRSSTYSLGELTMAEISMITSVEFIFLFRK